MDELLKRLAQAKMAQANDPAVQQAAAQFAQGEAQRAQPTPSQFPMINSSLNAVTSPRVANPLDDQSPEAILERRRKAEAATAALIAQQNKPRPLPGE